eukprot:scaffold108414_cov32-Tisochrysis_lutea.AAC.1
MGAKASAKSDRPIRIVDTLAIASSGRGPSSHLSANIPIGSANKRMEPSGISITVSAREIDMPKRSCKCFEPMNQNGTTEP